MSLAQQSTIFVNIIDVPTKQTKDCKVYVWKQMPDSTFKVNSKEFSKQTAITLDPGTYIFSFQVQDQVIHREKLVLDPSESCIVFNLFLKPMPLAQVDFKTIAYATPGLLELISRRTVYMEF